jgi:F0F1-type ATP synthase membrane subunit a
MNERMERFIALLNQIFEMDKSDLDFGIYRILNIRRDEIQKFFKEDNPKTLMILNGITAALWVFITAMNLYEMNEYAHVNRISVYVSGGLALLYIGLTLGYAIKYRKLKMVEGGETNGNIA